MDAQQATNQKFESVLIQLVEDNKESKSQITKVTSSLAIQEHGKFPSQPQSNPKGLQMAKTSNTPAQNVKEVNVITTQSGKQIEPSQTTTSSNKKDAPQTEDPKTLVRVPFPQALRSRKVLEN